MSKTRSAKSYQTRAPAKDVFVPLYKTLAESPAFLDLSDKQRLILLYMYGQKFFAGKNRPHEADLPNLSEEERAECFYFNQAVAAKWKLRGKNDGALYTKDIPALIEHGFIDAVANGRANHSRSIYKYSTRWKQWSG